MKKLILILLLTPLSAFAQSDRSLGGGMDRWNLTGPAWYDTKCGAMGMANGVGIGEDKYIKPCSIPVRVCEFERLTVSFPALPDDPTCKVSNSSGALKRTELRLWD